MKHFTKEEALTLFAETINITKDFVQYYLPRDEYITTLKSGDEYFVEMMSFDNELNAIVVYVTGPDPDLSIMLTKEQFCKHCEVLKYEELEIPKRIIYKPVIQQQSA